YSITSANTDAYIRSRCSLDIEVLLLKSICVAVNRRIPRSIIAEPTESEQRPMVARERTHDLHGPDRQLIYLLREFDPFRCWRVLRTIRPPKLAILPC